MASRAPRAKRTMYSMVMPSWPAKAWRLFENTEYVPGYGTPRRPDTSHESSTRSKSPTSQMRWAEFE